MQTAEASTISADRAEIPGMLATLCSYECHLGPCHPQTLYLMAHLAIAYWQAGEFHYARPLLEKSARDLGRYVGRDQEPRLRALAALRDLLLLQGEVERAGATQRELVECQTQCLGGDDPETQASSANLATILMQNSRPL
jgi:hypothetical protein